MLASRARVSVSAINYACAFYSCSQILCAILINIKGKGSTPAVSSLLEMGAGGAARASLGYHSASYNSLYGVQRVSAACIEEGWGKQVSRIMFALKEVSVRFEALFLVPDGMGFI